jgi:hypothetical protein
MASFKAFDTFMVFPFRVRDGLGHHPESTGDGGKGDRYPAGNALAGVANGLDYLRARLSVEGSYGLNRVFRDLRVVDAVCPMLRRPWGPLGIRMVKSEERVHGLNQVVTDLLVRVFAGCDDPDRERSFQTKNRFIPIGIPAKPMARTHRISGDNQLCG